MNIFFNFKDIFLTLLYIVPYIISSSGSFPPLKKALKGFSSVLRYLHGVPQTTNIITL